jgi:hypothetical protein
MNVTAFACTQHQSVSHDLSQPSTDFRVSEELLLAFKYSCLFDVLLIFHTCAARAICGFRLFKVDMSVVVVETIIRPMELFFKYRVVLYAFKFSLKISDHLGATVGAATSVGEVITIILHFFAGTSPWQISSASSVIAEESVSSLTNCLFPHPPSSPSSGPNQYVQLWRNNEGGVLLGQQSHRQGQHGHGRCACESESLVKQLISKLYTSRFFTLDIDMVGTSIGLVSLRSAASPKDM